MDGNGNESAASSPLSVSVPDWVPPSPPTALEGIQEGADVVLDWKPSSDDVGVDHYAVFRDGSEIGDSTTHAYTDHQVAPKSHSYAVYAVDAAGNRSTPGALALSVADRTPPTAPANLSVAANGPALLLSWDPSHDDIAVSRYVVLRDGARVGTTTTSSFREATPSAPGSYAYSVYAEDAAGNAGGTSPTATLTVQAPARPAAAAPSTAAAAPVQPLAVFLRWRRAKAGSIAFRVLVRGGQGSAPRLELFVGRRRIARRTGKGLSAVWVPPRRLRRVVVTAKATNVAGEAATNRRKLELPSSRSAHGANRASSRWRTGVFTFAR